MDEETVQPDAMEDDGMENLADEMNLNENDEELKMDGKATKKISRWAFWKVMCACDSYSIPYSLYSQIMHFKSRIILLFHIPPDESFLS